ncbi:hypothetical protein nbrc107697_13840 [Gordonia crocea]|uniref:Uncharacterized protein n=2 Tax=Gordonia crocea TaxID=589162 RepID=A0A7I9UW23_9ACTN|nr:hypothetical protein nbrc107697_13840 [Gordonia crocea]
MATVAAAALTSVSLFGAPMAGAEPALQSFTSPSGNVACLSAEDSVRCDIRDRSWAPPPRPADCPSQTGYGQGIALRTSGKPQFVCAGDTTFGAAGRVLQYGERAVRMGYSCTSEPTGVTCRNGSGNGFTISREAYRLF